MAPAVRSDHRRRSASTAALIATTHTHPAERTAPLGGSAKSAAISRGEGRSSSCKASWQSGDANTFAFHASSLRPSSRAARDRRILRVSTHDILALANRLGFEPVHCPACNPIIDPECGNCEGTGFLWRRHSATLARSGLMRLASDASSDDG